MPGDPFNDPDVPMNPRAAGGDSTPSKADSPWITIGVGVGMLVVACWAVYMVGSNIWFGLMSPGWETTQGTVVKAALEGSIRKFSPTVVYRYQVNGKAYENNRISFPDTSGSGDPDIVFKKLTAKYPPGGGCRVHYDPANPARSCLEPGVSYLMLCVIGPVAIGFLVLAVAAIRYGLWERKYGPTPLRVYISRPLAPRGE